MFEKSLIETYIKENGKDPITGDDLHIEDLVEIKNSAVVKPRPPALTSIPSLLSALQSEWEALTLETFTLKKQLVETRQELSSALYHQDAAIRVVARVTKERDEARESLAQLSASLGQAVPVSVQAAEEPSAMDVDLPSYIVESIEAKGDELKATRKKRVPPEDWAVVSDIEAFKQSHKTKSLFTTVSHLAINNEGTHLVTGGGKGAGGIFSIADKDLIVSFKSSGIIVDATWIDYEFAVATKNGNIDVFNASGELLFEIPNANSLIIRLILLPVGTILLSVSKQNRLALHDLTTKQTIYSSSIDRDENVEISSVAVHPDGELFAFGCTDGQILIYSISELLIVHTFSPNEVTDDPTITALEFSENGYWLLYASRSEAVARIWHLGKLKQADAIEFKTLEGDGIIGLKLDYTGQFVAAINAAGNLEVAAYNRAEKSWTENVFSYSNKLQAVDVCWGQNAKSLVTISAKGNIHVFE